MYIMLDPGQGERESESEWVPHALRSSEGHVPLTFWPIAFWGGKRKYSTVYFFLFHNGIYNILYLIRERKKGVCVREREREENRRYISVHSILSINCLRIIYRKTAAECVCVGGEGEGCTPPTLPLLWVCNVKMNNKMSCDVCFSL